MNGYSFLWTVDIIFGILQFDLKSTESVGAN